MTDRQFHCKILGVATDASLNEIKRVYLESAKLLHPDKHENSTLAKEKFQQLQASYEYLLNNQPDLSQESTHREPSEPSANTYKFWKPEFWYGYGPELPPDGTHPSGDSENPESPKTKNISNDKSMSVLASVLFVTLLAFGAWKNWRLFAPAMPDKRDKADVSIVSLPKVENGRCDIGSYAFEVRNYSKYTVNKVNFKINGLIPGRSTKYDLSPFSSYFISDAILTPFQTKKECLFLHQENWPIGESLIFEPEIVEVEFKTKDGLEIVN